MLAAESYERRSYDQLNIWSHESSFPYSALAAKASRAIQANLEFLMLDYNVPWSQGVDPQKMGMDELLQIYGSSEFTAAQPNMRVAMIQYIARRFDISEKRRLQFLINVIRDEPNLKVLAYAGKEFKTITKLQGPTTDTAAFLSWWKDNEAKFP